MISLFTHPDRAPVLGGQQHEPFALVQRSFWMADHRLGLVDNPVSSRKIRKARRLFQGLARTLQPPLKGRRQPPIGGMAV